MKRRSRGSLSREEILGAALDIVTEDGISKLSMRQIAKRLKCSVASPYAYFESQEEIIRSLIIHGEDKLTLVLKEAQASSDDVYEQLMAIAYGYWNFARQNKDLHRLMFATTGGVSYRRIFTKLPTSYRVFLETLRSGIRDEVIVCEKHQLRAIARTMWSWMYGLILSEMSGMLRVRRDEDPIAEGFEMFAYLLRHGWEERSFLPNLKVREWYDERVSGIKQLLNRE